SIKKKTQELLDESFSSIESGTDNMKDEIMITRCTRSESDLNLSYPGSQTNEIIHIYRKNIESFHLDNEKDFQESVNEESIHTSSSLISINKRKEQFN
ncbi:hypothetical protein BpHYR1_018215, partial [Brachionus plicatilis]